MGSVPSNLSGDYVKGLWLQEYFNGPKSEARIAEEAARTQAEALKKRKGYQASIVTGPQGVTAPVSTQKTMLGQ
jgi:hypothetical protein